MDGRETSFALFPWGCTADQEKLGLGASSVEAGRSPGLGRQESTNIMQPFLLPSGFGIFSTFFPQ